MKKRLRRLIAQRLRDAAPDNFADAHHAEVLALKIEVGDLLQRVQHAQPRIELQAVDNLDLVAKPDVFRAKVAMPVHDAPPLQAFNEKGLFACEAMR